MKNQPYHKATFQERCKYDRWVIIGLLVLVAIGAALS